MSFFGWHDGNPKRTAAQKLAGAVRVYRQRAQEEPAFRARYGDEPTAVLTSALDAEELLAAGVPLDVRGSAQVMRGVMYLSNGGAE